MIDPQSDVGPAMELADANPHDVETQIAAAWACDRHGSEFDAIRYYDAAWALEIPDDKREHFMVGYGSTLRNVRRFSESVSIHRQAVSEAPGFAPHRAFLALALHSVSEHEEALAAALRALIEAGSDNLDGYDRALSFYIEDLLGES